MRAPTTQSGNEAKIKGKEVVLENGVVLCLTNPEMRKAARFLQLEIYRKQRYARPGFEISDNDVVVDIGANMGVFSLWAANRCPKGRVIAIEPTSVLQCLDLSAERNGMSNIKSIKAGIGTDGEQIKITTYPGFNIINHQAQWASPRITQFLIKTFISRKRAVTETAPCVSLDEVMKDLERVDFLKVDCEGAEYVMFEQLSDDAWARIGRIAMEFHEYSPDHDHQRLVKLMQQKGFEVEVETNFVEHKLLKYGMMWATRKPVHLNS
jgi:FkbM family methyltransferase